MTTLSSAVNPSLLAKSPEAAASDRCFLALGHEAVEIGKLTLRPRHAVADGARLEDPQQRWHRLIGAEALDQAGAAELGEAVALRAVKPDRRVADIAELVSAFGHAQCWQAAGTWSKAGGAAQWIVGKGGPNLQNQIWAKMDSGDVEKRRL